MGDACRNRGHSPVLGARGDGKQDEGGERTVERKQVVKKGAACMTNGVLFSS